MFHAEKREGLVDNVTCMMFQVDIWAMYNYRAWALAVLTTTTELIIDSKGALVVTTVTDPKLVMLANLVGCYHEAFGHYSLRLRHWLNN